MSDAMATNEALGAPNPAGQLAVRPPAETSDAERSAGNAEELAPMLAREGLTLEEVLPSDAGGWVRMLSALETEDRSWPFGALAEIVDAFVLDSTAMPTSAPRAVKIDVDADAQGSVTRFTVAADGAGMTQAQMAALVGAPGAHDSMPEQGALRGGGGNISPALLQTGRACLAVTRAAEDSSIGRAVMALVSREPLVGGGGGGGLGGGRGNYVMPLTVVNAEGKPVAGGLRAGAWLANRCVNVQKRGDPSGSGGGAVADPASDAHAGEGGWFEGTVERVDVQAAKVSFVVQEADEGDGGGSLHIGMKPWRVRKRDGSGWWSPNEAVWQAMRRRVSEDAWQRALEWLEAGVVGTLLIIEDMTRPGLLLAQREPGGVSGGGGGGAVVDVTLASGAGGTVAGRSGGWAGEDSAALPLASSLSAYLEVLYKGRQAELLLCGELLSEINMCENMCLI